MHYAEPAPATTDDHDSLDGWERAVLDRQLEALFRLADMGMALAGEVERRATAETPGSDAAADDAALRHAAMDFARVSRAVRMTFALQSRLIADFKAGGARPARAEPLDYGPVDVVWRDDVVEHDVVQKRQVRSIIGRLAEAAALDREAVERVISEAGERLEDDGLYRDLKTRPLGEIVALICQDLGLAPDWSRVAEEYWAQEEIARRARGSPFAAWTARRSEEAPPTRAPPPAGAPARSD